jgi:hypothetical protein
MMDLLTIAATGFGAACCPDAIHARKSLQDDRVQRLGGVAHVVEIWRKRRFRPGGNQTTALENIRTIPEIADTVSATQRRSHRRVAPGWRKRLRRFRPTLFYRSS